MLLRRMTQHVKDQNWFAVGLDFLIVVLGVFLGLQVNNWNEARSASTLGQDYTVRLIADLEKDLAGSQIQSGYYAQVLVSIETADQFLASSDPDPKALVAAAYRASEFSSNPTNRATWDQVVSSGHLGLLPNEAIASGLSDYYKFQDENNETNSLLQGTPYRLAVRSLIPLPIQLAIRDSCGDVMDDDATVIVGFADECQLDVDDALLKETAQALMSSGAIRETLRHQYSMVALVRLNNDGNITLIERVIDKMRTGGTER